MKYVGEIISLSEIFIFFVSHEYKNSMKINIILKFIFKLVKVQTAKANLSDLFHFNINS